MKVVWEEQDIIAGVRYSRKDINEIWLIGFLSYTDDPNRRYVSISLNDGMVTEPVPKQELADNLTANGYLPISLLKHDF